MSFVDELKQRKVFKVGAAYVVAGWLAVQVASIALPAFEAPAWAMRAFILAVLLGFPVALLVSWAFDRTEHGLELTPGRRFNLRLLAICAGLAILSVGWFFLGKTAVDTEAPAAVAGAPATGTGAAAPERSIAVLPFRNLGGQDATLYLSDGLAETSLDMLARVPGLKVISRSSSFTFRDAAVDVADAGVKLGVNHLLTGTVQPAGDRVRVTVQLVRAADAAQLWSGRYDRQLTDVFAIQDEIASEVVKAIQIALPEGGTAALSAGGTRNVAAYEAFLKGNQRLWTRQVEDMRAAGDLFKQAHALDPGYVQAETMALVAELLIASNTVGLAPAESKRFLAAYDDILRREPRLAEAYIARGNVRGRLGDSLGSLADYDAGLALSPNLAVGHQWRAELLFFDLERIDEASAAYRRAIELDPITPQIRLAFASALVAQGRPVEAMALMQEVREVFPDNVNTANQASRIALQTGDFATAFRTLKAARDAGGDATRLTLSTCSALVDVGAETDAARCLDAAARLPGTEDAVRMQRITALLASGRREEAHRLWSGLSPEQQASDEILMVVFGPPRMGLAALESVAPGLLEQPPRVRRLDIGLYGVAALLLQRDGREAQAKALLEAGLARLPGAPDYGDWGVGWSEAFARGLQGDTAGACAAMRATIARPYWLSFVEAQAFPELDGLRAAPCFEAIERERRAKVDAALAPLRAERLWPGAE